MNPEITPLATNTESDVPDVSGSASPAPLLNPVTSTVSTSTHTPNVSFEDSVPDISGVGYTTDALPTSKLPLGSTQIDVQRPIDSQVGNYTPDTSSDSVRLPGGGANTPNPSGAFDELLTMSYGAAPEPAKVKSTYKSELAQVLADNPDILESAGINTPARLHMFLATMGHESNFKAVRETPSRFASSQSEFPGMGIGQITGRANWKAVGDALGVDFISNRQLMLDPVMSAKAAAAFWKINNLNRFADSNNYHGLGIAYNGAGMTDYARRVKYLEKVQAAAQKAKNPSELVDMLASPGASTPDLMDAKGTEYSASRGGAARLPITHTKAISDAYESGFTETMAGRARLVDQVSDSFVAEINKATGGSYALDNKGVYDHYLAGAMPFSNHMEQQGKEFMALIEQVKKDHPDVQLPVQDFSPVLENVEKIIKARKATAADNEERDTAWTHSLASMVGSMGGWLSDPVNAVVSTGLQVGLTAATGGISLIPQVAIGAASMGVTSAVKQPVNQAQLEMLGEKHGLGQAVVGIGNDMIGGAVGAVVAPAINLAGRLALGGVKGVFNRVFRGEWAPARAELKTRGVPEATLQQADSVNTLVHENPLGANPLAFQDMEMRFKAFEQKINNGEQGTILPPEITGLKVVPKQPIEENFHIEALQELGYADVHTIAPALKNLREYMGTVGNSTPEEYMAAKVPTTGSPSPLMRQTMDQLSEIESKLGRYKPLEEIYKDAHSALKSRVPASAPTVTPKVEGVYTPRSVESLQSLKVDIPDAKLKVQTSIDLNRGKAIGAAKQLEFSRRQAAIYETKYQEHLEAMKASVDDFDRIGSEQHAYEYKQVLDNARRDGEHAEQLLKDAVQQHKQQAAQLKALEKAEKNLTFSEADLVDEAKFIRDTQRLASGDYSQTKGMKAEAEFFQRMAVLDAPEGSGIHQRIAIAKEQAAKLRAREMAGEGNTKDFKTLEQLEKDIAYYTKKVKYDKDGNPRFDTRAEQAERHIRRRIEQASETVASEADAVINNLKETAAKSGGSVIGEDGSVIPLSKWVQATSEQVSALKALNQCLGS